ncbi:MAG: hypothetical protein ACI8TX_002895 [Hyphomicrobiaceae bacterium]|jgi:hypothetical protein
MEMIAKLLDSEGLWQEADQAHFRQLVNEAMSVKTADQEHRQIGSEALDGRERLRDIGIWHDQVENQKIEVDLIPNRVNSGRSIGDQDAVPIQNGEHAAGCLQDTLVIVDDERRPQFAFGGREGRNWAF